MPYSFPAGFGADALQQEHYRSPTNVRTLTPNSNKQRQGIIMAMVSCLLLFLTAYGMLGLVQQIGTCRGEAPPSCCARPFCRLKAPLGLSLLRCAAQTRTFENTLISAACKKKKGKLWQKERETEGIKPLDKATTAKAFHSHPQTIFIPVSSRFAECPCNPKGAVL